MRVFASILLFILNAVTIADLHAKESDRKVAARALAMIAELSGMKGQWEIMQSPWDEAGAPCEWALNAKRA